MTAGQPRAPERLTKRWEFLRAARGQRTGRSAFSLQAVQRDRDRSGLGFTVTKQTGNAPERNRIKRRLRAAAAACADGFRPQHDYVLIGRRQALTLPFDALCDELRSAQQAVLRNRAARPRKI